jgi:hypothetical protein
MTPRGIMRSEGVESIEKKKKHSKREAAIWKGVVRTCEDNYQTFTVVNFFLQSNTQARHGSTKKEMEKFI